VVERVDHGVYPGALRLRGDEVDDHPRNESAEGGDEEKPDGSDRGEREERGGGSSRRRLRIPGERFEHVVQRPPEEPVEQDRTEARDDPDDDGEEHEAVLRREPGQLPRKPVAKGFDDFHGVFVIIQIICVRINKTGPTRGGFSA